MKILLAAFKQETSSFNPARMPYDMFNVLFGDELLALRGSNTEIAGALDIFAKREDIDLVPIYSASSVSGGPVADADLNRLMTNCSQHSQQAPADGMLMASRRNGW